MRDIVKYELDDPESFRQKLLIWSNKYPVFCYLESNNYYKTCKSGLFYHTYDTIAGVDFIELLEPEQNKAFLSLKEFVRARPDWLFGHFSYDLKNEIENLTSDNFDGIGFPAMHFFQPRLVFTIEERLLTIHYPGEYYTKDEIILLFDSVNKIKIKDQKNYKDPDIRTRTPKQEYIDTVNKIKANIFRGDIYEINYCHEYYCENQLIDPLLVFNTLRTISPTPFSCLYKLSDKFLISASPERFLKKTGDKIISQPMKGTIKRSIYSGLDEQLRNKLRYDPKEIAENVMIVDLVRNDLSKTAAADSVKVEELCGIYSFKQVHQMVSTVSAVLRTADDMIDAIKNAFPMGSMTGAPKIRAMELIEEYENTGRGLFSGAVGYFSPDRNFDFNVVIRSILYNKTRQYLSYLVGSAITARSVPEKEYEECLVKARAINQVFNFAEKEISDA
ncbi:MAG: anthranilate synthase component I family protein [Bacteroidales bacterium]|nr:MAG: anthranilate synthase component I family protein [Bacteroidales bacterium]